MTPFKEEVRSCFSYLFEKLGFKFVDIKDDFGGNIVIAQSDKLRIRFIRDRVDFFLDVGNLRETERWTGFYKILDQLKLSDLVTDEYTYSNRIKTLSKLLSHYFSVIQDWFLEEQGNVMATKGDKLDNVQYFSHFQKGSTPATHEK